MGILLCEQNFRDVWRRNKSVRGEIGKILRTHKHTHAAKLVVRIFLRQTYFDMQDVLSFNLHLSHGGLPLAGDHREVSRREESATPGQDQVSCS